MPPVPTSIENAVLAVLRQVREAGVSRPTRTSLIKLVYLLDCLHAEEHQGATASGSTWYFHHFGPYAADLADALSNMSARGVVQSQVGEFRDLDYTVYWLGEFPLGPSLDALGLGPKSASRFQQLLRRFAGNLNQLLDHVYFHTSPMLGANPGEPLNFSSLAGSGQQYVHRPARVTDQAVHFRMLQLANQLKTSYENGRANGAALAAHRPIYDGEFFRAMDQSEGEYLIEDAIPFTARLA